MTKEELQKLQEDWNVSFTGGILNLWSKEIIVSNLKDILPKESKK